MEQSQKQYDDTIAKLNSQSGGAPSLGAMAAAWNMLQDSNSQLDAYKQQFRQQAYQEYMDAYNRDLTRLQQVLGMQDREFERAYGVNSDMINDRYYRPEWESKMRSDALAQELSALNLAQNKALSPYVVQQAIQAVQMGELELDAAQMQNLITQAKLYGINFNDRRGTGGNPDGSPVQPPANTAYDKVVKQVENIVNEPNRLKSTGLIQAVRMVMNSDLSAAEKKQILETPSFFNATQEEVQGAYERIYS